ncbi:unnamed protein product [Cladocopium goreaui]|uniref:Kinesin-like protein KIF13A (Kinesin-like protein RBKIN) n=1 Tax=Cladocopium goreaui TaxID=2562237 RepID=A0A9P1GNY3_9DINO|nr:unnamed protein product [Cladocopium goreaui]
MKTNHHEPANSRTIKNPIQKLVESVFHPFFCFFFKAIALGVLASRWPQDLFSQKSHLQGDELRVWASFVEIYNEQLRDLLEPSGLRQETQSSLRIMDHPALGVIIPGLVEAACQSVMEVKKLIRFGLKKRVTSATIMNNTSSRSHAVFILKVQRLAGGCERSDSTNARMNLVDLAGEAVVTWFPVVTWRGE